MSEPADPFTRHIERWKSEQAMPWAQLKYRIVAANLAAHLPPGPLAVLDAGGGNGVEALEFARAGHTVTLVDSSAAMLDEARTAAAAAGLVARLQIIHGDVRVLQALAPAAAFDLVLCHNGIQYVPNLEPMLDQLATVLRPAGLLSLVSINRYSVPYQAAFLHHDLERAYASLGDHVQKTTIFETPMTMFTAEEVTTLLAPRGFRAIHHYGVRCLCDYWGSTEEKLQPAVMAQIERIERQLTAAFPYKHLARYFQLIAQVKDRNDAS
jgi:S-adenosylmethionine-dependent methyltransferase